MEEEIESMSKEQDLKWQKKFEKEANIIFIGEKYSNWN